MTISRDRYAVDVPELERDIIVKLKFVLVGVPDTIIGSFTIHPGNLLPVGLP